MERMLACDVWLSIGAAERFGAAAISLLMAMYKRTVLAAVLSTLIACADPGFRVTVTRPVAERIERACVAQALRADSTFSVIDTVARPWLRGDTVATIGDFTWHVADVPWPQDGWLSRHAGIGSDTLVATFGRLGAARPGEVQRAAAELSARVNAVVDQCARPLAPAHCEFSATGRGVAPCPTGGA
jgi:hypothetical protein